MNQNVVFLSVAASVALAGYSLPTPGTIPNWPQQAGDPPALVAPDPEHLQAYFDCSKEAERRILSHAEAAKCLNRYLLLKLSFLPDVEIEAYMRLGPAERWANQQSG